MQTTKVEETRSLTLIRILRPVEEIVDGTQHFLCTDYFGLAVGDLVDTSQEFR